MSEKKGRGLLLILTLFFLLLGCHAEKSGDVPDELIGVWRAPKTKYEGRFFEISYLMFNLGVGGERISVNFIRKVERQRMGPKIMYTFFCEDLTGLKDRITLYYDPSDGGTMKLKNQPDVEWRKDKF